MINVSRRRFFNLLAAPAIVRAGSLMPVRLVQLPPRTNPLLTINAITREAVERFKDGNVFLRNFPPHYADHFIESVEAAGAPLRVRVLADP